MNRDVKAILVGGVVFVVITSVVLRQDGDRSRIDAMTLGGLAGGMVALGIRIAAWSNAARRDAPGH